MTFEHFLRGWRSFLRRRPFVPFLLQMASGETVRVRHPEAVRFYGEAMLLTEPNHRKRVFDAASVCQLLDESTTEGA